MLFASSSKRCSSLSVFPASIDGIIIVVCICSPVLFISVNFATSLTKLVVPTFFMSAVILFPPSSFLYWMFVINIVLYVFTLVVLLLLFSELSSGFCGSGVSGSSFLLYTNYPT